MAARTASTPTRKVRSHAAVWREHHAWCLRASMKRLAARPVSALLTVLVMGFALALPLAFWLVLGNVQQLAGGLGTARALNVFMQVDAAPDAANALAGKVRTWDGVAGVDVITPAQGMQELASVHGFDRALDDLGYNPLPYALVVELAHGADAATANAVVKRLQVAPEVDRVQDDRAWRKRLDALLATGQRVAGVLALLLALAAVLVVGNSVRMDIQASADELGVLKLVGASHAFVRRPYLYTGLWYGLAGGVVASLVVWLAEGLLAAPVHELVVSYGGRLQVEPLAWWQLLVMPAVAAILGWLGARAVSAYWLRRSD